MAAFYPYTYTATAASTSTSGTADVAISNGQYGYNYQGGMADPRSREDIERADQLLADAVAKERKRQQRELTLSTPYRSKFDNSVKHKAPQRCRGRPREDRRRPLGGN